MPYEVVAKSDEPNAWLLPANPGLPEIGPFKLDDGRDIYQLIADGDIADLEFTPTFRHTQGSHFGDLLWTTCEMKVASSRFIKALSGFSGWRSFDIHLLGREGETIDGYKGFAVVDGSVDVFHTIGFQFWSFGVSDDVMAALRTHSADDLEIRKVP